MTFSVRSPKPPQAGFTLPEILAVIALIGILVSTVVTNFGNATRDLSLTSTKDILLNDIPSAMLSYRAINGDLDSLAKTNITDTGVPTNSPYGDSWTLVSASARTAVVDWSLSNADDAEGFGDDLKASLDSVNSAISTTAHDKSAKKVTVTYRIP